MVTIVSYPPLTGSGEQCEGKFVHLNWGAETYLLFARRDRFRFHNQIVAHFCSGHQIDHCWASQEHLDVRDPTLQVKGGGRFTVRDGQLTLWDQSSAYGRFYARDVARALATAPPPWGRFQLHVQD